MTTNRLQPCRAGFLNFWYYDQQEFEFADGKLLLRGSNGSGKSVTMQSLIPVLLDGQTSPGRLDPFGSRARRMDDYLLGEVCDKEERTGYIWLEFRRQSSQRYLTCGIGLRARRHASLEFWGFVITDNRRIGESFHLHKLEVNYETGKEEIVPLSRRELNNRLQGGGRLVETRRDYAELVNRHIFGFKDHGAYEDLIKLLIQLRSPKLSRDFKPTVIYEILNSSLPPLSEDELRPLSETIENMDQIKQQLDQLQRDEQSMVRLSSVYDSYNRWQLALLANSLLSADERCRSLGQNEQELCKKLQFQRQRVLELQQSREEMEREQTVLESEQQQLQEHDVFAVERRHQQLEQDLRERQAGQSKKQASLDQKQRRERKIASSLREQSGLVDQLEQDLARKGEEMGELAAEADLLEHQGALQHWRRERQSGNYSFVLWEQSAEQHLGKLEKALAAVRQHRQARAQFDDAEAAYAEASRAHDDKARQQQQLNLGMDQLKEDYLQRLDAWWGALQQLQLTKEERLLVSRRVVDIYEPYAPRAVMEPIDEAWSCHREQNAARVAGISERLAQRHAEIADQQAEINRWREQSEPEPERHPDTEAARQALAAANVPHLPFYAAVEFREEVTPRQRERVEAAISEAGLLDALIVPPKHLAAVSGYDKVLIPNPQLFAHTLADILQPVPSESVDGEAIDNVLRSILWGIPQSDPGAVVLNADGRYRIALLSGQAPPRTMSRFIGREARRRYREEKLQQLGAELAVLQAGREQIEHEMKVAADAQVQAAEEYRGRPTLADLERHWASMSRVAEELRVRLSEANRRQEMLISAQQRLLRARNQQQLAVLGLNLQTTEDGLSTAAQAARSYKSQLHRLQLLDLSWQHARESVQRFDAELQAAREDVDELQGELNVLVARQRQAAEEIKAIERRLLEMGAKEIRGRITQIVRRLQSLPQLREQAAAEKASLEGDIGRGESDLATLRERILGAKAVLDGWQQLFVGELTLGLHQFAVDASPLELARRVNREMGHLLQTDAGRIRSRLNDAYYREQGQLTEYRPTLSEQNREVLPPEVSTTDELAANWLQKLQEQDQRLSLTLEYKGRTTDIFHVLEALQHDRHEQQLLLEAKDRELYQEIIVHSVGEMIRQRINRADAWVKKISRLMEERDTSSGLTFSLAWRPRTAEHEDELDTKELVELLRIDPILLKPADSERIAGHFRSQIERARLELAERQQDGTLQMIIQRMLDYRLWFDFKLYFRKEGEQRRELTDRVFFTFSGGEKAMAMYIPLFSAAYSRYQDAAESAPRLITLDEAFAGVDETNIRDMFALMQQLEFCYIINSQGLWGDYDTAGRLAISELVRPKNAPFVTVVPYLWDGAARHLQVSVESEQRDNG